MLVISIPPQQVEFFNNKILNIASNLIPDNYVKILPEDPSLDHQQPSKDVKEPK